MSVKDLLQQLAKQNKTLSLIENARVLSVDKDENTCNVTLIDTELELTVKLKSVTGSAGSLGFITYPQLQSIVSICMVDDDPDNLRVLDCTAIESITLTLGSKIKLQMDPGGAIALAYLQLTLGGGKNGGLVKIEPLVKKINNLEDKVNDVLAKLKSHVHGGAGSPPTPVITISALDKTKLTELENKDVKH